MKKIVSIAAVAACFCLCLGGVFAVSRGSRSKSEAVDAYYYETTAAPQSSYNKSSFGYSSASITEDMGVAVAEGYEETVTETVVAATDAADSADSLINDTTKIIYTADMRIETTEFDDTAELLKSLVEQYGGYFERNSVSGYSGDYRSAYYTIRIPAEYFDTFIETAKGSAHVTYVDTYAEDVSDYYYDVQARLETAKIKLERLQALLEKAENMEDIITLEQAISEAEYEVDNYGGTLTHYDKMVAYSTITLNMSEVYKITEEEPAPVTFGERLGSAFKYGMSNLGNFFENIALWLAESWAFLLIAAGVTCGAVAIARKKIRKKRAA